MRAPHSVPGQRRYTFAAHLSIICQATSVVSLPAQIKLKLCERSVHLGRLAGTREVASSSVQKPGNGYALHIIDMPRIAV